ncbi:hypothetical protein F5Y16DRAFT_399501 [Xylariaceae sp. FL0255]|nr:hypothetical protein F5Y16DRAFT_399501 [Xylariaceae sp. FL0255]
MNSDYGIVITSNNVNPILQILSWLLLATSIVILIFRLVSRFYLRKHLTFGWDDGFLSLSFIFALGVWITWFIPQNDVFGKPMSGLSNEKLSAALKVEYARELFCVGALVFSKLSVCANMLSLTPDRSYQLTAVWLGYFLGVWLLSSWLVTAFQCGTRGPWNLDGSNKCINQLAFLIYLNIISIISDVVLVVLPILVIHPLHMALKFRTAVLSFYSLRVLVIGATIVEIIYLPRRFEENFTLRAFPYYLAQQLVTFTTITASCVLYFWPLLRSLETGRIRGDNFMFQTENRSKARRASNTAALSQNVEPRLWINLPPITPSQRTISTHPQESSSHDFDTIQQVP